MKKALCFLCLLLSAVLLLPAITGTVSAADIKAEAVPKTYLPKNAKPELQVIKFDFSEQMMSSYVRNGNLAIGNRGSMNVESGTLRNSSAQPMSFGSGVFVGVGVGEGSGVPVSSGSDVSSGSCPASA